MHYYIWSAVYIVTILFVKHRILKLLDKIDKVAKIIYHKSLIHQIKTLFNYEFLRNHLRGGWGEVGGRDGRRRGFFLPGLGGVRGVFF